VHCSREVKWPVGCEDGLWLELAQELIQWQPLVLVVFSPWVLPPENQWLCSAVLNMAKEWC
jgi:hypothetical protein